MARYRGPLTKIARRFGEPIFGPDRALDKRNYPPGQHGFQRKRGKKSEYSVQLAEKQKAKYTYGILERQFRIMFDHASRSKGITGEVLLQLCERRLDNVVYRLGIAPTRRAARQLVTHCHITVNGEVLNIPSYLVTLNDVIAVRERSKSLEVVSNSLGINRSDQYPWVQWNSAIMSGKMINFPTRDMIPENIKEQLIVELYSK
ncbi:MAG: 30S ribosomal protein S4 [Schleiferiaceae bacterium]|nr:30S ribosomal protein S4 [Schleiferiaceae bacterium]MDP4742809.1 30S ribosomal protein S4 [Schleiferiaceae bacterium]MDP4773932.1 30S ribosomal protein S4 [Schleiferiaceae bacterium]MDP4855444.1 30S ribosomal protein S4 [Schleiferiaceae bacterium]MDP4932948.1 30S ribosomal protein S4 [Schleiferiaceae bacterium]